MSAKSPEREWGTPQYLGDYIARSSVAMEQIAGVMDRQEEWMKIQWPQLVDTLNSDFLLHNQRTEQLCAAITESTQEMMTFRKDVWSKMWTLFERVLLVTVGVLAAIAGWRIIDGV